MGLTRVPVELSRMNSRKENGQYVYSEKFLVDTGAMDSMAPASELRKVGIQPVGKRIYEFANGEVQEYEHALPKSHLWARSLGLTLSSALMARSRSSA